MITGIADKGSSRNDSGRTRPQRCSTIGTTVTYSQEYRTRGGGDTGRKQRCGMTEIAFFDGMQRHVTASRPGEVQCTQLWEI